MKIIQIMPEFGLAGAETMCENLSYELIKQGVDVIVISLYEYHSAITERMEKNGIKILYLDKKPGLDFSMIRKMIKIFNSEKPDVIHTHRYVMQYAIPAAIIARIKHRVHTMHSVATKENSNLARKINSLFYRFAHVIPVALSEEVQKTIVDEYHIKPENIPVVLNGVDLRKCIIKSNYSINGKIKILHIGRFAIEKNHKVLVESIADLSERGYDIELYLYGQGELEASIKELVKSIHKENNIYFCGLTDDIYSIMPKCDMFVLPSIYEGVPMTLIEAMGTGMPILASNVGGIPDMIENEESGLLCEPTVDGVVRGLERLIESEEDRKRYGENAIISSEKFSADKMAKDYYEIYVKACRGRK